MIYSLLHLIRKEMKDKYPAVWTVAGEALAVLISLTIYRYTAKAFTPVFAGTDYFSYLVTGELVLYLPLTLFSGLPTALRASVHDGTLEAMLALPIRPQTPTVFLALARLLRELTQVVLFFLTAALGFGYRPSLSSAFLTLGLQVAALPAFFGLGLLGCAMLVRFGRGDSLLTYTGAVAGMMAGAFFPISVLPENVRNLSLAISPFSLLLETSRELMSGGAVTAAIQGRFGSLLIWGVVLFPLGYWSLGESLKWVRRRGAPIFLYS